ncbi:MAG: DUF2971 domain-containing protein [Verrucomicrobiaceae bacterium]|nr:DUF2971 domain-containing protein [Verrucomicrobiaceae bacterium]
MNPNRLHNRHSFYKYTTANVAKAVLDGQKLRWSVPSRFNDPFDVPREILDSVDEGRLNVAVVDRMKALLSNPCLPNPKHHSPMTKMLLRLFSCANANLKGKLLAINEQCRHEGGVTREGLEAIRKEWRAIYDDQRIVCFTESWNSASMWDRYASGHTGALLEFACLDHLDSSLLTAKQVNYTDDPLTVNTPSGLAELLFYDAHFAMTRIMEEYTHTKTTDWAYEKEWRIASWKRPHEMGDYSDYEFAGEELAGITFGAQISAQDMLELAWLLKRRYPHAKIWKASIDGGRQIIRREV